AQAGSVLALEAGTWHEVRLALLVGDLEDLDPLEARRKLMRLLARFGALSAAIALSKVDDHRPLPLRLPRLRSVRLGERDRGKPYSEGRAARATKGRHQLAPRECWNAGRLYLRAT